MNRLFCKKKKEVSKLRGYVDNTMNKLKDYWLVYAIWLVFLGLISGLAVLTLLEDLI